MVTSDRANTEPSAAEASQSVGRPPTSIHCGPREEGFDSVEQAVRRNAASLWRYFLFRVQNDQSLADELMQEVSLQVCKSGIPCRDDRDRVDGWMFGLARNVLRRYWRSLHRRRRNIPTVRGELGVELADQMEHQYTLPEQVLQKHEYKQCLLAALTTLPSRDQELLLGHYFDGKDHAELAKQSGMTARSVEGRLYRARQRLKEQLQHLQDDELI